MLEEFHAHAEQNPVAGVVKEIMADVEENFAEDVNDDNSPEKQAQHAQIGTAERTVDDQFEKPGQRHSERSEDQKTDRGYYAQPPIRTDETE